ncbi:DUF4114 domain-containing protein [Pseudanabaena sp. FACHB-2040]|uniref:DUF4114 domain-containing protein n=1 Tax=Pseudanabaena sp. FACHB-2040 TaxID=2692859 RepID=UPI0016846564|nr:DUF4114 domain-containing protein [Pseudanabaena sp. FACHB-2040]MBD2258913.1 DUF4114 domain-containing protein [Pseudanabaena sp. FACHB-2040]
MNRTFVTSLVAASAASLCLTATEPAHALALRPDLWSTFNSKVNVEGNFLNDAQLTLLNPQSLFWNGVDPVEVFFINEGARYRNQLFYSANGGSSALIFNDISSSKSILSEKDGPLSLGQGVNLGSFSGPTQLDFAIKADGFKNANGYTYGANPAKNPDQLEHLLAFEYFDVVEKQKYVLLAFEDLFGTQQQGSDRDFNDVVFVVRGIQEGAPSQVPEPSVILGMLVVGGGALTLRRRVAEG